KYMNAVGDVERDPVPIDSTTQGYAVTQPGVYYRDFEKQTLAKHLILPSYPASRELCAMGGIVANNSGGERTLEYGKTEKYVEELDVVLSDGTQTRFKPLSPTELEMKRAKLDFEGEIYRKMNALLRENTHLIQAHKPKVSKNSAGYALWNVIDPVEKTFNLAKLICGSQGTLALWTEAKLRLVTPKEHRAMLVVFLSDLSVLPEVVKRVLPLNPESFESYDDNTFTLAVKFLPEMLAQMGFARAARLGIDFIPEAAMVATGGVPKLILMAEFAEDTIEEADRKAVAAKAALEGLPVQTKIEKNEKESEKYWIVRRESFALLRKNLHGFYASPFIDDFVVPPETYTEFLPELNALLAQYKDRMIYTVAGHIGNGNFHIIPLMDLNKPATRKVIMELAPRVYDLVIKYGGTTTGEHNDGIIRTPYLGKLFGPEMEKLFEETKKIFDPLNIFNPGKKVGGTMQDIENALLTKS
ncbi:MAG TPA: FAD-binding oxidoreductase, partial [Candidatus Paceibacterota bacterium]|nr:FAD-binding oxidoreductase [Candidatus Paceibacterota bacterium]